MADQKITELDELTTSASTDMLAIVDDPDGSPITKKIQVGNIISPSTKEFFCYPDSGVQYSTSYGGFLMRDVDSTSHVWFNWVMPHDFTSLTEAVIIIIPDTSKTIQWDLNTDFAAEGEAWNVNSTSSTDTELAVTANQMTEIDVSGDLSGVAANDYCGIKFLSDTSNLHVGGLRIKYT